MSKLNYKLTGLVVVLTGALTSCIGSGPILTGAFVDSPVDGVHYNTPTRSGMTGNGGQFQYHAGEQVSFHVGDIDLGNAMGKDVVTPIDLMPGAIDETHQGVTNMVRFMMTLDSDGNAANGIHITQKMHDTAVGMTIDFDVPYQTFDMDSSVNTMVMQASNTSLVDANTAQMHLNETMTGMGMM